MILGGAAGKSAQFPLHVWLPDAMEGPTTVSALIHAATMVAAGVYLLAITSVFLGFTATDQFAIVAVGGFTTFFAATMAVVHPDIKRVIAYSTISQLGYMVLAVGAGFAMVGLFHLFTHAFFKALLFLAAGSVIHAIGTQDLFKMGGLRKPMRITVDRVRHRRARARRDPAVRRLLEQGRHPRVGVLASSGAIPAYWPFFLLAFAAVFLTAYYIFRVWFLAFSGDHRRDDPTLPARPRGTVGRCRSPSWFSPPSRSSPASSSSSPASRASSSSGNGRRGDPAGLRDDRPPPLRRERRARGRGDRTRLRPLGERARLRPPGGELAFSPSADFSSNRYYFKVGYDWVGQRGVYGIARGADFIDRYVIDGTVHGFERAFAAAVRPAPEDPVRGRLRLCRATSSPA